MSTDERQTKWDIRFLQLARFVAAWSKDPSTKVGAVITDWNRSVISLGYNGFARGVIDSEERYNNREEKYKLVVHAERNAMLFAQKPTNGCTLYTWPFMPCAPCAGMVIQSGICRVVSVFDTNPRWQEDFALTRKMFKEAAIELVEYATRPEIADDMRAFV